MNVDEIKQVVQVLAAAIKGLRLYAVNHPATAKQVETLQNGLFGLLQHKKIIKMGILEGTLFVEDHLFMDEFPAASELAILLEAHELIGFEFMAGLSAKEIQALLNLIHSGGGKGQDFADALTSQGVKKIRAIAVDDDDDDDQKPRKVYRKALKVVDQIFQDVRMGEIPSSDEAINVVKSMAQLTMTEPHAMMALSMLKDYDNYTFTHSVNVSVLALAVGRACNLTEDQLKTLGLGGLLHDLGKLRIDVDIITKPGRLTDAEFDAIKEHPGFGAEIIKEMEDVTPEVMQIVLGHHMRYDRSGYPADSAGSIVSPLVEMTAIADAYDAMTTLRSYQRKSPGSLYILILSCTLLTLLEPTQWAALYDLTTTKSALLPKSTPKTPAWSTSKFFSTLPELFWKNRSECSYDRISHVASLQKSTLKQKAST